MTTINPFPTTSLNNPFAPSRVSTTTPTSFSLTTYSTSHAPSSFTRPTAIPSLFSFGPASSCASNSASQPTPLPSHFPLDTPAGSGAACVISNDRAVNDHAFWDLYACCKGSNLTAIGTPNLCSAQCSVGAGQSVEDLGECLRKRVDVVVCRVGAGGPSGSQTSAASSGAGASGSQSGSPSPSTGGANAVGVVNVGGGKVGVLVFGMLAVGSFVGMLL